MNEGLCGQEMTKLLENVHCRCIPGHKNFNLLVLLAGQVISRV